MGGWASGVGVDVDVGGLREGEEGLGGWGGWGGENVSKEGEGR